MGDRMHGVSTSVIDVAELAPAARPQVVDVAPGGSFDLRVGHIAKRIGDSVFPMLAYNGSIPGPTLRVQQGSAINVNVRNETDMDTTVHWHGLRLENRYDGVPHETQRPVPAGGTYTHVLEFPDPGVFWYHPHVREDYQQELGLYGNVIVQPADAGYWPPATRDIVLTLDDILVEHGAIAPFDPHETNFAAMGRYGNVLLVAGETQQAFDLRQGDVARFWLTNTANSRVFKIAIPGCRLKLVGGDAGRYEREVWVDDVVIAPSERAVVDVRFADAGVFELEHLTPDRRYPLAQLQVAAGEGPAVSQEAFATLRHNADLAAERERIAPFIDALPDKTLALVAVMDVPDDHTAGTVLYVCPMHPEVTSDTPDRCPKCGMKLLPSSEVAADAGDHHDMGHDGMAHHGHDAAAAPDDGIEWEDEMLEVNRTTTTATMHWKVVDRATGAENAAIDWTFEHGQQVKIRLVNEMDSDHPMHHPFHVHGERFLVLTRDGVAEDNLVWKDTVLIRRGETVEILMDASNPGLWMAHCHIAEHMASGMMFHFRVHQQSAARQQD